MRICNDECLALFRGSMNCDWCGLYGQCEPSHLFARGMGDACRLDVPINLNGLCHTCHMKYHNGHILRISLLALIAQREGETQDIIETEIYRLRSLRKDANPREGSWLGKALAERCYGQFEEEARDEGVLRPVPEPRTRAGKPSLGAKKNRRNRVRGSGDSDRT